MAADRIDGLEGLRPHATRILARTNCAFREIMPADLVRSCPIRCCSRYPGPPRRRARARTTKTSVRVSSLLSSCHALICSDSGRSSCRRPTTSEPRQSSPRAAERDSERAFRWRAFHFRDGRSSSLHHAFVTRKCAGSVRLADVRACIPPSIPRVSPRYCKFTGGPGTSTSASFSCAGRYDTSSRRSSRGLGHSNRIELPVSS